jgi:hypothetical protein
MHVKESDGKIFYIGKGSGRRAFSCSGRSKFWHHVEKKHGFRAEILMRFEKESDAFEHEKFLISCFREINTQLVNLTDGGEGSSGFKLSEETKIKIGTAVKNRDPSVNVKISNSLKGKIASEGTKLKLKERIVSKETRLKMSLSKLGRKKSDEHRKNISRAAKGRRFSEATRAKLSEAAKKQHQKRRGDNEAQTKG